MKKRMIAWILTLTVLWSVLPVLPAQAEGDYPNTYQNTGNQRYDIIQVALTQVGYQEGEDNYTKYGEYFNWPNTSWCGWFVSWCAIQAEVPTTVLKRQGLARVESFGLESFTYEEQRPQSGDLYFKSGHVGFVYKVEGDYFWTVEGNSNDQVEIEKFRLDDTRYWFASPAYDTDPPQPETKIPLDEENFPDGAFRAYLRTAFDDNDDGQLSKTEINEIKKLSLADKEIASLAGIENFKKLQTLDCSGNQLTSLNLAKNTALQTLDCSGNALTSLDLGNQKNLKTLRCGSNGLTSLNLTGCAGLTELYCSQNRLTELDVQDCPALTRLDCRENALVELEMGGNPVLRYLRCADNKLVQLNVAACVALEVLECDGNALTELDLFQNAALRELNGCGNLLVELDLSANQSLTYFDLAENRLTSLHTEMLPALEDWICHSNSFAIALDEQGQYDLTQLPGGFDVTRASNWTGGTVSGNVLTVKAQAAEVTYDYDCGGREITFTLVPQWQNRRGDVSQDGKIDTYDLLLVLYHTNQRQTLEGPQRLAADVNGDGAVDVWDVQRLVLYINKRVDAL